MATIYQRREGGNWYLSFSDPVSGRRIQRSTKTTDKALAQAMLHQHVADMALSRAGMGDTPILRESALAMLEADCLARGSLPATAARRKRDCHLFLASVKKAPHRVTRGDVEGWLASSLVTLAARTVANRCISVWMMFDLLADRGYLRESPCHRVRKPRAASKEITYLSAGDARELLGRSKTWRDGRMRLAIHLALGAGLRIGEITHLEWDDVDLVDRTLKIRPKEGWTPKSKKSRVVPLTGSLWAELESGGAGWVVSHTGKRQGADGRPTRTWFSTNSRKMSAELGISFNFHELRHTYASLLVQAGVGIYKVSKLLGHASVKTTEKFYAALKPDGLHSDVELLPY